MFIYTVKANTLKFLAVIIAATAVLVSVVVISEQTEILTTHAIAEATKDIKYDKIKNEDDRRSFLEQFGWETEDKELESVKMKLPAEFDRIMTEYNDMQKIQGPRDRTIHLQGHELPRLRRNRACKRDRIQKQSHWRRYLLGGRDGLHPRLFHTSTMNNYNLNSSTSQRKTA